MISEMLKHILWAAIGAGAGYYVAREHLKADFDARLQSEIEQTRAFYKNLYEKRHEANLSKTREQADILKAAVAEITDAQEDEFNEAFAKAAENLMATAEGTMLKTDVFYNFVEENLHIFKGQEYTTLEQAWVLYKYNAEVLGLRGTKNLSQFREELKGYFEEFHERKTFGDKDERNVFVGFIMHRDEADAEPEEMPEEAAVALVNYQGISAVSTNSEPVGGMRRILDRSAEEEELTYVKPDGPRIIDFQKYDENGGDHEQHTVVYYTTGNDVSDENDKKLSKEYIGKHISYANLAVLNESNPTIYVRDDANRIDHEVIWSAGSYAVDVLGETPE